MAGWLVLTVKAANGAPAERASRNEGNSIVSDKIGVRPKASCRLISNPQAEGDCELAGVSKLRSRPAGDGWVGMYGVDSTEKC